MVQQLSGNLPPAIAPLDPPTSPLLAPAAPAQGVAWLTQPDPLYPDSDGKPMAESTEHFSWIVYFKENLELLFAAVAEVFVAGDLLWYAVQGKPSESRAPDTMVVFGRPKGARGSYRQWLEDNLPPQVVIEVLSPGNRLAEMHDKFAFYDRHGVEEYYLYTYAQNRLAGWQRRGDRLQEIVPMEGWISPRLGVRWETAGGTLKLYRPDGQAFLTFAELATLREAAIAQKDQAIAQKDHAIAQKDHAIAQKDQAIAALNEERQERQAAEARARALEARLRELGVEP